eukprot:s4563_g1.t4
MTDMCGTAAWQHERQTSKPDIGFISRSPSAFSHRLYSSMALACASMDLPEDAHERTMHLPEDPEVSQLASESEQACTAVFMDA